MNNIYESKYLKYKKKYLRLKHNQHNQTSGGPFMVNLGIHLQKLPFGSYFAQKATDYCNKYKSQDDVIERINKFAQDYNIKPSTIEQCQDIPDTKPLECWAKFKTPNDFFIRKRINLPTINYNLNTSLIVAPCDSYCIYLLQSNANIWIKGKNFSLDMLLFNKQNPDFDKTNYELLIFRLAPQHYHRFHSPINGQILNISKYGTKYYSVDPIIVNSSIDVYTENVRLVIKIKINNEQIAWLVIIGATCIGSIELTHKQITKVFNNKDSINDKLINESSTIDLSSHNILIQPNEELGYFQYGGSTVVLVFTKGVVKATELGLNLQSNQEIELKVGDELFK